MALKKVPEELKTFPSSHAEILLSQLSRSPPYSVARSIMHICEWVNQGNDPLILPERLWKWNQNTFGTKIPVLYPWIIRFNSIVVG